MKANHSFFSDSYLKIQSSIRRNSTAFSKLLTNQEMIVLSFVAQQKTDAEIGQFLRIGERTVESHRTNIMHKLGVHSRVKLMQFAHDQGFDIFSPSEAELNVNWNPSIRHDAGAS